VVTGQGSNQLQQLLLQLLQTTSYLVLYVRVTERSPAELLGFQVDHATAADSGWRCLFQVRGLKHEVHVIGHLNYLSAHQTQLQQQAIYCDH